MKTVVKDIPYANDTRQVGDLHLPPCPSLLPPVLLIHGGGWNALAKESISPLIDIFLRKKRAVFNINYRLLNHAPWPACGDDCLNAGRFVFGGGLTQSGLAIPDQMFLCGASAGGHLAMMTGLRLPRNRIEGILSLAGPSRIHPCDDSSESAISQPGFQASFFGSTLIDEKQLRNASPAYIVGESPPPLTCIHSRNDRLVPPTHSEEAVAAWKKHGGKAVALYFDGPGLQHGFWDTDDGATRQPIPELQKLINQVISSP